jgi:F-type H+-transporting ATPase subunit delta
LISASVSKRYAKALVEAAASPDTLERVRQELRGFADLLAEQRELRQFLANPSVPRSDAAQTVSEIVARMGFLPLTATFLRILLDAKRLAGLGGILGAYESLVDERLGRIKAVVTSAAPLSDAEQNGLRRRLSQVAGGQVYLELRQDPALLGGVVTQIGSRVYDGSLKTQLARLREELVRA